MGILPDEFATKPSIPIRGLFVGIEHFPSPTVEDLDFSTDDAYRQCEAFQLDPAVSVLAEEQATRINILKRLFQFIDESAAGELLVFSITGHGVIAYNDYFFTPYEADANNILGTCISASLLIKALAGAAHKGAKVLLVIDTCHSGAISFDMSRYKGGISCLFSCSPMELSTEMFLEGRKGLGVSNDRGGNGVFTHYLSACLEGAGLGGNTNEITLRSLYEYVYDHVAKASNGRQHPQLIGTLESDLVLMSA